MNDPDLQTLLLSLLDQNNKLIEQNNMLIQINAEQSAQLADVLAMVDGGDEVARSRSLDDEE